ncbi:6-carboxytetrahydropterin synthase [Coraliomargarita sp. SDUM461003]|uniref:6-carboxy-5,6,7,8-tetrahydropterin synthase n=1 Tax=Thalassobacterium maritimum TaxID=3041265 RepID=A0ABU1ASS3_9BACT|nr:6-carboxytetrahydropterin synthase [Coraliomargarita sp. SDUM461003]
MAGVSKEDCFRVPSDCTSNLIPNCSFSRPKGPHFSQPFGQTVPVHHLRAHALRPNSPAVLTCKKSYRDIPFAHRQHHHSGHCALIHGHNWTITLTFACNETDENGFVLDFGKVKYLKKWIDENLDHACLFNESDPEKEALLKQFGHLFKAYTLPTCSCEGLAEHIYHTFNPMVRAQSDNRAWITEVEIEEDNKNSAAYRPT